MVASIVGQARPVIWPLHNDTIHRVGPGADFYGVYHAGHQWALGRSLYDHAPDGVTPYYYPFRYLPIVGWAAQGLQGLGPAQAWRAWIAVLEALLAAVLFATGRLFPAGGWRRFARCVLLLSSPYFLECYMGQFTFAATGLMLLGLTTSAGIVAFALGVLLKIVPLLAAPSLARERRTWPYLALAVGALLATSAPYFATHPEELRQFVHVNFQMPGGLHGGNFGVTYLGHRLAEDLHLPPVTEHWKSFSSVYRFGVLATTVVVAFLSRDRTPLLGPATLLLAHFVSFVDVWEHNASGILLLGLMILAAEVRGDRRPWLALAAVVLLALPTPFALFDHARAASVWDPSSAWPRWQGYAVLCPKALPVLVLFGLGLWRLCRAGFGWPWSGGAQEPPRR